VAARFGRAQGVAAQSWVEAAVESGDASSESLMQMQLALFDECKVDDDTGRCKALSEAIEALDAAVAERKNAPKKEAFGRVEFKATPIQAAATKLRASAAKFGPEQKEAADEWIKKVTTGKEVGGAGLLEEQIALFGECVLSEGSTPSDCQRLVAALGALQEAVEECRIAENFSTCEPDEVVGAIKAAGDAAPTASPSASAPAKKGRKRDAVKGFFKKLTGGSN